MSNIRADILTRARAAIEKFTYFLLAAAAASIAYAINLDTELAIDWPDMLLIAAIVVWGFSFWAGTRVLAVMLGISFWNALILKEASELDIDDSARHLEATEKSILRPLNRRMKIWELLQMGLLVFGAFLVLLWKIALAYPDFTPFK